MKNYTSFNEDLNKRLKDPKFKKVWEELEPEYQIAKSVIEARLQKGLTQTQLAEKAGTTQPVISRIERGTTEPSPSISTLKKIFGAAGKKLEFSAS